MLTDSWILNVRRLRHFVYQYESPCHMRDAGIVLSLLLMLLLPLLLVAVVAAAAVVAAVVAVLLVEPHPSCLVPHGGRDKLQPHLMTQH